MKGDYRATSYDAWSVVGPVLSALRSAAITWVRLACCFAACQGTKYRWHAEWPRSDNALLRTAF